MGRGELFLFFGFSAVWTVLALYMWSLAARQKRLADDIAMLSDVLGEKRES